MKRNSYVNSLSLRKALSLLNLKSKTYVTKIYNSCTQTGRTRAVIRKFKVSRIVLRESNKLSSSSH